MVKRYTRDDLTVVWQPDLCWHSGICARGLPAVFDPHRRPWIQLAPATPDEIRAQVKRCPSGALSLEPPVTPPAPSTR